MKFSVNLCVLRASSVKSFMSTHPRLPKQPGHRIELELP